MDDHKEFLAQCAQGIAAQGANAEVAEMTRAWIGHEALRQYSYHFSWLGRPIIQYPQDIVAMQELIFAVQPDLIIETGIARGGSLILYASLLELNALCGGPEKARVLGIDIDLRDHNRKAIEAHPLYARGRIHMLQGSSIDPQIVHKVQRMAADCTKVMVLLDSNHTHDHVLAELMAYAPLVSLHSYCVVFDTVVQHMPEDAYPHRPWGKGDNPMTAVDAYLKDHPEFVVDTSMDAKLLISVAPKGYLQRKAVLPL